MIGGVLAPVFHRARLSCEDAASWVIFVVDNGGFTLSSDVEDPLIHDISYCTFFLYLYLFVNNCLLLISITFHYPKLNERLIN